MERIDKLHELLSETFSPLSLDIRDDSAQHIGHPGAVGGGGHFTVTIVSDKFRNMNMLERHRAVYAAVNEMMHTEIHALSIRALAPNETT